MYCSRRGVLYKSYLVEPPDFIPLRARAVGFAFLKHGGRGGGLLRSHVRGEALGTLRARRLDQRCLVRVRVIVVHQGQGSGLVLGLCLGSGLAWLTILYYS